MAELRQRQSDIFSRIKFTPEREPIRESRDRLEGLYQIELTDSKLSIMIDRSAQQLKAAATWDLFEVEGEYHG